MALASVITLIVLMLEMCPMEVGFKFVSGSDETISWGKWKLSRLK